MLRAARQNLSLIGLFLGLTFQSVANAATDITFTPRGGEIFVEGRGFVSTKRDSFDVNLYADDDLITSTKTTSKGSFSAKVKLPKGKKLIVSVLEFNGPGKHFKQSPPEPVASEAPRAAQPKNQPGNAKKDAAAQAVRTNPPVPPSARKAESTPAPVQSQVQIRDEAIRVRADAEAGRIIVQGTGFDAPGKDNYSVNVYLNGVVTSTVTKSGAFRLELVGKSDSEIEVKVLEYLGQGNHFTKKFTVPAFVSNRAVAEYARRQAGATADRVANKYGEAENWRFNFATSYQNALKINSAFDLQNSSYKEGLALGTSEGRAAGNERGRSAGVGASTAAADARAAARQRFIDIVDKNLEPDTTLNIPNRSFDAPSLNLAPPNLEQVLTGLEIEFRQSLDKLRWLSGELRADWSLKVFAQKTPSEQRLMYAETRGENALKAWKQSRPGTTFDLTTYRTLTETQAEDFDSRFVEAYQDAVDQHLDLVRQKPNFEVQAMGALFGTRAAAEMAKRQGHFKTYTEAYAQAWVETANQEYRDAYKSAFFNAVTDYETHPKLEFVNARVTDSNGNGFFESRENLDLQIGRIVNLGRQDAINLPIQVAGQNLTPNLRNDVFSLRRSSSGGDVTYPDIAKMGALTFEEKYAVTVRIGEATISQTFGSKWEDCLSIFSHTKDQELRDTYEAFILARLDKDWEDIYYRSAAFDDNRLIVRLVNFYKNADLKTRAPLLQMKDKIYNVQKKAGSSYHWMVRGDWKSTVTEGLK